MKNRLKINAKTIENRQKIDKKWIKNHSWRGLGGPLGALGGQDRKDAKAMRTFGASWGHLGAVLGASWGRLGAWIAVLGCIAAVLRRLHGPLKNEPKIKRYLDASWDRICCDLAGFGEGEWSQVGTEMKSNMGFPENTEKAHRS